MSENKEALQTKIDIQLIYNKGRRALSMDEQRNRNVINILKHGEKLLRQLNSIPNKNGQIYSKYHNLFKIIRNKASQQLQQMEEDTNQMGTLLRKTFNQIIDELGSKARRYEEGQRRIRELGALNIASEKEQQEHEEAIKTQMLQLIQLFKNQAKDMGKQLKNDELIIQSIESKQEKVQSRLKKQNSTLQEMIDKNSMGFLKLITYSCSGIVIWLLTILIILAF